MEPPEDGSPQKCWGGIERRYHLCGVTPSGDLCSMVTRDAGGTMVSGVVFGCVLMPLILSAPTSMLAAAVCHTKEHTASVRKALGSSGMFMGALCCVVAAGFVPDGALIPLLVSVLFIVVGNGLAVEAAAALPSTGWPRLLYFGGVVFMLLAIPVCSGGLGLLADVIEQRLRPVPPAGHHLTLGDGVSLIVLPLMWLGAAWCTLGGPIVALAWALRVRPVGGYGEFED